MASGRARGGAGATVPANVRMSAPIRARWHSTSKAYALVPVGVRGVLRGTVVVGAVLALAACGSTEADAPTADSSPHRAVPEMVAAFRGETPFVFALAVATLAHDDVDRCKELVSGRAAWASIAVTKAADGFVFAASRTPTTSEVADIERAVRDCDLGLTFSLPDTGDSDGSESFSVEPVDDWAAVNSGDAEGVRWTIYRADANPDLDGSQNACYSIEVGPSSGPVLPTTTIDVIPDDNSFRGLPMSCGWNIGPEPKTQGQAALFLRGPLWQGMRVLGEDTSNESYVWIAGEVAPEVDHVRVEGVDVPVVEQTFLWLSRDSDLRPERVELPALDMECRLEYDPSYGGSIAPDCPLLPKG